MAGQSRNIQLGGRCDPSVDAILQPLHPRLVSFDDREPNLFASYAPPLPPPFYESIVGGIIPPHPHHHLHLQIHGKVPTEKLSPSKFRWKWMCKQFLMMMTMMFLKKSAGDRSSTALIECILIVV